ncbi:MAG TPA: peptidase C39 family protein [Alphaproteobacteria bacterium]|nr:peptidase C39 family protein [Alphaproteobacteria bacterium]
MTELRKPIAWRPAIRTARVDDIPGLVALENRAFAGDRVSPRSFRHLLTRGNAATLVEEEGGVLRGYAMLLFNRGTSLARLYSFAVAPEHRGRGIAKALLAEAERVALEHGCIYLRLEVRRDNHEAQSLYRKAGYREFGMAADYYDDHMDAVRMEKPLSPNLQPGLLHVPYYPQTLEFTCGPAALMMAMCTLDPKVPLDRKLELRLWREATTIFMTTGHGGCSPFGMALSAESRGFDVEVYVNDRRTLFEDTVRKPERKAVIRLVQEDFLEEMREKKVTLTYGRLGVKDLIREFERGGIPIVLISSYRIDRDREPHWVVVTGFDERFIYVHDPYVDWKGHRTTTDCINMPITKKDFERMARFGRAQQKAALIIRKAKSDA